MENSNQPVTDRYDWNTNWSAQAHIAEVNPAQNYRHRLIVSKLGKEQVSSCLDVGCGQGDLLAALARKFPLVQLYGIEGSEIGADIAKSKIPRAIVWSFDLEGKPSSWPEALQKLNVDAMILSEVVEHLNEPASVLKNLRKFLNPSGILLVTVPAGPMTPFDRAIGHRTHFTSATLRELLETSGYEVVTVQASGFPFFNLYKLTVLIRGQRLSEDINNFNSGSAKIATAVMRIFGFLFRLNLRRGRLGWQLVAFARPARN